MELPMFFRVRCVDNQNQPNLSGDPNLHSQRLWTTSLVDQGGAARSEDLVGAVPPEFSGPGGGYSPEDFFALAIANCFMATFKVIAEKSKLAYTELRVDCQLEVDKEDRKFPWMARARLVASLSGTGNPERGLRLLQKVSGQCLVHQSIQTKTTYEFHCES